MTVGFSQLLLCLMFQGLMKELFTIACSLAARLRGCCTWTCQTVQRAREAIMEEAWQGRKPSRRVTLVLYRRLVKIFLCTADLKEMSCCWSISSFIHVVWRHLVLNVWTFVAQSQRPPLEYSSCETSELLLHRLKDHVLEFMWKWN